jgi:glutamate-1-semialdehyde 2,1-aminomutase
MPGGNTRAATHFEPYPVGLEKGEGWRVWDVDGNEFIDLLNNYTSLVHGHRHPAIHEAISNQLGLAIVFPAPSSLQAELAERICTRFPSIEQLRFTNSGSEAVMMAVRAARAFTGRDSIVKAAGGYHGAWEQVALSSAGTRRNRTDGSPAAVRPARLADSGIPGSVRELVHLVEYNDSSDLEAVLSEHGDRIAAIVLEPVIGEEAVAGTEAYLGQARRLADRYGALLVFDEVVTARLSEGGAQQNVGVTPDLTILGKIIGGGLPVGAFGGRVEIMELFDPRRSDYIPHHGTFNGNLLTMAAGCASLDLLTQSEIDRINGLGQSLATGLERSFQEVGAPLQVASVGSLILVSAPNLETLLGFHAAGLDQGLYFAPRGLMNVTTPMDGELVREILERATIAAERAELSSSGDAAAPRASSRIHAQRSKTAEQTMRGEEG